MYIPAGLVIFIGTWAVVGFVWDLVDRCRDASDPWGDPDMQKHWDK